MSRCKACDAILNDYELVRKNEHGEYVDLCSNCLRESYLHIEGMDIDLDDDSTGEVE